MSFLLGLTGSIGMGKSTTARLFVEHGCRIWNADDAVHEAYSVNRTAVTQLSKIAPTSILDGCVDRRLLRKLISNDPTLLAKVEAIIHPIVEKSRQRFIKKYPKDILVFDIPLLFETGSQDQFDAIACVLIDYKTQLERVLARKNMTKGHFDLIFSKQLPAIQKANRADYVIDTSTPSSAKSSVIKIITDIKKRFKDA